MIQTTVGYMDLLVFNLNESQFDKIETTVLPAWTSYLTEHNEDNALWSTSEGHWPFHSTL